MFDVDVDADIFFSSDFLLIIILKLRRFDAAADADTFGDLMLILILMLLLKHMLTLMLLQI